MKIKRHKKVHKSINFYVNNFGFRQPFQVLIDGTFCLAALKNKINIQDQLPKYLQSELKLLTTPCVVLETEDLGPKVFGAMKIVKQFSVHKCGHNKQRVSGSDCLRSMIGERNDKRYIVATQDRELQDHVRTIPGVPLVYLHLVAPILEQPSDASLQSSKLKTQSTFSVNENQGAILSSLKERSGIVEIEDIRRRRRKKKGPNPLSCLKKKKKGQGGGQGKVEKKQARPKRKKIHVPKHVKQEIVRNK